MLIEDKMYIEIICRAKIN
uniref:Uncharacterized protein n=1 Tax=Rhizophora mucronata TaxID=61149 RepID=A0A2P2N014_RHIMU